MNSMTTNQTSKYTDYIQIAQTGHYPLFFDDWVFESMSKNKLTSVVNANKMVKQVFSSLDRHQSTEKKRTALLGMDKHEREEFIRSFFKVVEHELLKDLKSLQ